MKHYENNSYKCKNDLFNHTTPVIIDNYGDGHAQCNCDVMELGLAKQNPLKGTIP